MEPLSPEFIAGCRREGGRIIRGDNMTRIETFVDAAFAFAFTMLVISIDEIPTSPPEMLELSKDIPAFVFSALVIGAVWLTHSNWSRTFGLQDPITMLLSLALVVLMLVFVYPIKLVMQATVVFIGAILLEIEVLNTGLFENEGWADNAMAGLFIFFALGLMALGAIVVAFYQNALRFAQQLHMTAYERDYCHGATIAWIVVCCTALLSLLLAMLSTSGNVSRSGFVYASLTFTIPLAQYAYKKFGQTTSESGE